MNAVFNGVKRLFTPIWLRCLLLLVIVFTITLSVVLPRLQHAHADNPGWPTTYLGDNGRSNFNSSETIINPSTASSLQLVWEKSTCCEAPITSQPVVANNLLYWGLWSGRVQATKLNNGNNIWTHDLGLSSRKSCEPPKVGVVGTSTVATVTINGQPTSVDFEGGALSNFYALDAMTGKQIWRTPLGGPLHFIWGSVAFYNGDLYIGTGVQGSCVSAQSKFYQLDAATGQILNTFSTVPSGCTGAPIWGSAAIDEQTGMLYFATGAPGTCSQAEPYANAIVELNTTDLSYVNSWQIPSTKSGLDFRSTPTLFSATINGTLYQMVGALSNNGTYYALDRTNLSAGPLWQDQLAAPQKGSYKVNTEASTWDGTTLYVAADATTINGTQCASSVSAINPADGSYLWQDCLNQGPALWTMGVPGLVVFGDGNTFNVADATNGTILYSYTATRPGAVFQGSATISNGVLYIGDAHGDLYAFAPGGSARSK
ncbi:MAG TPA: PQQ-binding-like beta-propeller repeat protein [Ktedonobacteraceae bacterium]|nr:PQQ-binding-like beta-propeller repeat protein [Ktedonobacteraceae bacterium]